MIWKWSSGKQKFGVINLYLFRSSLYIPPDWINKSEDTINRLKKIISLHVEKYNIENFFISFIGDGDSLLPQILENIKV